MSNTETTIARLRTSMCGGFAVRTVTPAAGFIPASKRAATVHTQLADARNGALGGLDAWSPPV